MEMWLWVVEATLNFGGSLSGIPSVAIIPLMG
jgi:hypothetical protein